MKNKAIFTGFAIATLAVILGLSYGGVNAFATGSHGSHHHNKNGDHINVHENIHQKESGCSGQCSEQAQEQSNNDNSGSGSNSQSESSTQVQDNSVNGGY